jgi:[ribosomal protein S18]-alanine N-acetyltransferase
MLIVRRITSYDIDSIMMLQSETPEAPHWDRTDYERIVALIDESTTSRVAWVALDGTELFGFVVAHLVANFCELESIVVAKSARRTGIGRVLFNEVINWSTASAAQKIELEVRNGNDSALAFYESAGFVREGFRPRYYRGPEDDAILMGKRLYSDD